MLKKVISLFVFSLLFNFNHCQIDNWKLFEEYPSNCSSSQYFDTISLQCKSCPDYTTTSSIDRKLKMFINAFFLHFLSKSL